MQTEWKQQFRNKMDDFSETPPAGLWDGISSGMDTAQKKHGKGIIVFLSGLAAAAAALLIVVLGPETIKKEENRTQIVADRVSPTEVTDVQQINKISKPSEIENHSSLLAIADEKPAGVEKSKATERGESEARSEEIGKFSENVTKDEENDKAQEKVENEPAKEVKEEKKIEITGEEDWNDVFIVPDETKKRRKDKKLSFDVFASTIGSKKSNASGYDNYTIATTSTAEPMVYGNSSLADIMMFNRTREVTTDSRHFLPVRAGVTLDWNFAGKWSLQTGVSYAWLLSKFRTGSESYYYTSRQNLHYLGIPLHIKYNIWENNVVEIYASAGGMMEKCVGGSLDKNYFYGGEFRSKENERLTVKPLQWSVSVNAGVRVKITRLLGIYAEPGAIYYFKNSSPVETAFSENPFNFNFNIGFRFSL